MTASAERKEWTTAAEKNAPGPDAPQHMWWPPQRARVYIETVKVHWRTLTPAKLTEIRGLLTVAGKDLIFGKVNSERGPQGEIITVHRMGLSDAITLHKFCEANADLLPNLNRFDLSIEYPHHVAMTAWLKRSIILNRCPPGWMASVGDTLYWHYVSDDDDDNGKKAKAPTKAMMAYDDREKFGTAVSRVEIKFQSTQGTNRRGFRTLADVINMNPRELLREHIRVVEYDYNAVINEMVARKLSEKLASPKPRPARHAEVYDRFRDGDYLKNRIIDIARRAGNPIEYARLQKHVWRP